MTTLSDECMEVIEKLRLVYPSVQEKAANFLYLIVKNHAFSRWKQKNYSDSIYYFLQFYDILYIENVQIIDNNTLASLTILIANSKEKEIMTDLILNF